MSSAPMGIHCLMMSIRAKILRLVIVLYAKKGSVSILFWGCLIAMKQTNRLGLNITTNLKMVIL